MIRWLFPKSANLKVVSVKNALQSADASFHPCSYKYLTNHCGDSPSLLFSVTQLCDRLNWCSQYDGAFCRKKALSICSSNVSGTVSPNILHQFLSSRSSLNILFVMRSAAQLLLIFIVSNCVAVLYWTRLRAQFTFSSLSSNASSGVFTLLHRFSKCIIKIIWGLLNPRFEVC